MTRHQIGAALVMQLLTAGLASGQVIDGNGGLSVDAAIREALEREPGLRAARAEVDVAAGHRLQAGLRPNPSLSVERREEPGGSDNQTMTQVQWPLDLFRRPSRIEVANRELDIRRLAAADRARLLAADVRVRYGAAAAAVRDAALAAQAAQLLTSQLDVVRSRVDEGAIPPLERDQLAVEVQRFETERIVADGRVAVALIELKRAMGLPPDSSLRLRDSLDVLVATSAAVPSLAASTGRADVQLAQAAVRLAEAQTTNASAEGRVDVSLFGGYTRMNTGFSQRGFEDDGTLALVRGTFNYLAAGAMVTVPLGNRNQGAIAAARAQQSAATHRLAATQLGADAEVAAAGASEEAARRAMAVAEATVTLATNNLSVVRQAYELGRTSLADVLAEQRRALEVERAHTQAMTAVYEAHAAALLARGEN